MAEEDFTEIVHLYVENSNLSKESPQTAGKRKKYILRREVEILGKYYSNMNGDERKMYRKTKESIS